MTENASAERNRRTPSKAAPLATVRAKDHLSMAVVLSVASLAWFGWGHQGAQIVWWLRAGMVTSGIALVIATILVRRIPVRPTLATDPGARKVYWIAVVAEVVLILAGMFVLRARGTRHTSRLGCSSSSAFTFSRLFARSTPRSSDIPRLLASLWPR